MENLLSDESSEAAVENVTCLHEAVADAGGSAAAAAAVVARGVSEVALGADVALQAATSDAEDYANDYCGCLNLCNVVSVVSVLKY